MQGVETSLGYVHKWVIDPSTVMFTQAGTLSGPRTGFAVLLSTQRQAGELTQQDTGQFLPVSSPVSSGSSQASDIPNPSQNPTTVACRALSRVGFGKGVVCPP